MTEWLAAEDANKSGFVAYLPLFVPIGVVTAALIAALVSWWTSRAVPHDRLKTLIEVHQDWPADVDGKATVERQSALELVKLRIASGDASAANATPGDLEAEEHARRLDSVQHRRRRVEVVVAGLAFVALITATSAVYRRTSVDVPVIVLAYTLVVLIAGWVIVTVSRLLTPFLAGLLSSRSVRCGRSRP